MKISIIIPVYNCEMYLHTSVDSILQQTYKDWELILIDDGSTDNSGDLCDEYTENNHNIKVIHIDNNGPANARNIGLENVSGDYCIFVDSDDFLEVTALETLSKVIEKQQFDIIFYGYYNDFVESNKYISKKVFNYSSRLFNNNIELKKEYANLDKCKFTYPVWNKLYRLEFIKKNNIRFPIGINIAEDFIFNLQAYQNANDTGVIDDVLYHYVNHGTGSITTRFDINKIDSAQYVYEYSHKVMQAWNPEHLNFISNAFIKDISVYINNLFNEDCKLKYKEKYNVIKKLLKKNAIRKCIHEVKPLGYRNMIITLLIKYEQITLLALIGKISRMK